MDQKYTVVLEIGSSRIKGAVASVGSAGEATVIAVAEEPAVNSVRYGRVQNVQEVSAVVERIVDTLSRHPALAGCRITGMFVAMGGRSLGSTSVSASLKLPDEVQITPQILDRLKHDARRMIGNNLEILDIIPRSFSVDSRRISNVVGTFGNSLSGEFTAVTCSPDNRRNIERIKLDGQPLPVKGYVVRAIAEGDLLLTASEKQLGCVLVDFGAETTTVSIYKDNALRFVSTLPMGSRNITRDIAAGLSLTEERAEVSKRRHGNAVTTRGAANSVPVEETEVSNYVQARAGEIIANITNQIQRAGFKTADLKGGMVVVGGGARLRNLTALLQRMTKMDVRTGALDNRVRISDIANQTADNIDIAAMVAAVAGMTDCDIQCVVENAPRPEPRPQNRPDSVAAGRRTPPDENDPDLLIDDDDPDDSPDDDPIDDYDTVRSTGSHQRQTDLVGRMKERMARFFGNPDGSSLD